MAFGWEDYLSLANDLKDQHNEAALRSAVSRAYYAAFNIAKDFLGKNGIVISENKASVHQEVWSAFEGRGETWGAVYRHGDSLKQRRRAADYNLTPRNRNGKPKNWLEEVKHSIDEAKSVLFWLQKITQQSSKQ
jgi:uncharacterized protein (UPF0332 family)